MNNNLVAPSSYGGAVFSDIVGGTSPSYTGFSQIGGSKRRRRTKRKKGKRTRHCRCKICKCNKCRCNKKYTKRNSKKGGSNKPGYVAESDEDVMRLYEEAMEKERSEKAFDDAERQLDFLKQKGVTAFRDTDIMDYIIKNSDKESKSHRRSSPRKSRSRTRSPRKRTSSPRKSSPRTRSPRKGMSNPRTRSPRTRSPRTISPKINERAKRHEELLKKLDLGSDEKISKFINKPSKPKKLVKTKKLLKSIKTKKAGFVKKLQEVVTDGTGDYKQTGKTFDLIETGGGGDCFFHTIAYLVLGDKNKHYKVRRSMVYWVDNNREEIINKTFNSIPLIIVMAAQLKIDSDNANKVIDDYCRTMGRRGNWAEGVLEYYFTCRALLDNYGKKIKMMVYTFPCIPDPEVQSGKKCLRNIKDGYRENFCTIAPNGQLQNTLFEDNERGLIRVNVMNKKQGHFQALVESS